MAPKGGPATDAIMSPAEMKPLLMMSKREPVSAVIGMTKDKDGVILLNRRLKPKKLLAQLKADARKAKLELDLTSLRFGKAEVDTERDSALIMFTVNKDPPGALRMKLLEVVKRVPFQKIEIDVDAKYEAEAEDDEPPAVEKDKAWAEDGANIDAQAFTKPDDDVEQDLDQFGAHPEKFARAVFDLTQLRKDFTNAAHGAAQRAHTAMGDLLGVSAINWPLANAKEAAAVLTKSGAKLTKEDRAQLETDVLLIKQALGYLEHLYNEARQEAAKYAAAAKELNALPDQVNAPPEAKSDFLSDSGDVLEHIWDFINQMTQITTAISAIHLLAGTDQVKDPIKNDQTDKKIEAINAQLDDQREAINKVIGATKQRAQDDMKIAAESFDKQIESLQQQMGTLQEAIANYGKHMAAFTTKPGQKEPSKEAQQVMQTYRALFDAATASKAARHALDTPSLRPSKYQDYVDQLVPVGKPITLDSRTPGRSLFEKGNVITRYSEQVPVVEALASGMELVAAVYNDAPQLDTWFGDWSTAMQALP